MLLNLSNLKLKACFENECTRPRVHLSSFQSKKALAVIKAVESNLNIIDVICVTGKLEKNYSKNLENSLNLAIIALAKYELYLRINTDNEENSKISYVAGVLNNCLECVKSHKKKARFFKKAEQAGKSTDIFLCVIALVVYTLGPVVFQRKSFNNQSKKTRITRSMNTLGVKKKKKTNNKTIKELVELEETVVFSNIKIPTATSFLTVAVGSINSRFGSMENFLNDLLSENDDLSNSDLDKPIYLSRLEGYLNDMMQEMLDIAQTKRTKVDDIWEEITLSEISN